MAISRMGHIKENKSGSANIGLKRVIDYIINPEKTENYKYVSGSNIYINQADIANSVYKQMMDTKNIFDKQFGRQAYHYKISFAAEDNVSPELCMQITKEFCEQYLSCYETLYTAHTNTKYMHSHIAFNSVSFIDGKKYHYAKGDWKKYIQPIVNQITLKYKLSYIDLSTDAKNENHNSYRTYADWLKSNTNSKDEYKVAKYDKYRIRMDVDECITAAKNFNEFKGMMEEKGYVVDDTHKHLTFLAPGRKKATRSYILTPDKMTYTKENIQKMIIGSYIDINELRQILADDFEVFLRTRKIDISEKKRKANLVFMQSNEMHDFLDKKELNSKEELDSYLDFNNRCDRELNIIKKYTAMHIKRYEMYRDDMDNLLDVVSDAAACIRSGNTNAAAIDKAGYYITRLSERGISAASLYRNKIYAERLMENISSYKKKLYVDKIIAQRAIKAISEDRNKATAKKNVKNKTKL